MSPGSAAGAGWARLLAPAPFVSLPTSLRLSPEVCISVFLRFVFLFSVFVAELVLDKGMLSSQEACLYEGAKNALAKVTRVSLPGGRGKPFGEKPEEALEGLMDMLGLDAQPGAIVCKSESELIEVSSSTPLLMFLCEFAMNLRNEEPSPMELQVLRTRCTFVASLPDRVANAFLGTFGSTKTLETDLDLLATRICQSLCRFCCHP
ncbi:hypothetical protein TcCL_NonESM09346 [Trypanosoma cruzi]|nr:hypothetical protein TcCL_NonESM09346 [Trypanosoma cruzi]